VLSAEPSAQAERFAAAQGIEAVRLWTLPYDTLRARRRVDVATAGRRLFEAWPLFAIPGTPLYKGRLQYLEGRLSGPHSAASYFQAARPSFEQLAEVKQALTQARIEAAKQQVAELPQEKREAALARVTQEVSQRASLETAVFATAKQHASYWLGLTAFGQPNYPSAIDYFAERTLGASPNGPWTHGANYNLGRAYEATGQYDDAIEQYIVDTSAPGHVGSFLRARWLRELVGTPITPPGETEPGEMEPSQPAPEPVEPEAPEPKPVEPTPGGPAVELPGAVPPLIEPTPGGPAVELPGAAPPLIEPTPGGPAVELPGAAPPLIEPTPGGPAVELPGGCPRSSSRRRRNPSLCRRRGATDSTHGSGAQEHSSDAPRRSRSTTGRDRGQRQRRMWRRGAQPLPRRGGACVAAARGVEWRVCMGPRRPGW